MTNEEVFIKEVNNYITKHREQGFNNETLETSFAISVMLMQKYGLILQFNELMKLCNEQNIKTIETKGIIITEF